MGGFEFGNVQELNSTITLITFLAVIVFIVFFDILIGLMEYFLSGSQLYNRMIQMIYKELMLMGLVSFTIIMVEASQKSTETHNVTYEEWIAGIEFSHILIFYLTFFFVAHAFYLMRTSVVCSHAYRAMFAQKLPALVKELEGMSSREKYYFNSAYMPLNSLRDRVEFQLILKLFNETYFLCEGFNFASYLSGCFDRYALKTIDRSTFTWFVLMILSILNYSRIKAGFGYHNCLEEATDDGSSHRLLSDPHEAPVATNDEHFHAVNGTSAVLVSAVCPKKNVSVFIFAAIVLCLYTFIMLLISRMYKLRLINRIGLHSPKDYLGFLKFAIENEVTTVDRVSPEQLKKEIDNVMDADEYEGEESEYREMGEFLIRVFSNAFDVVTNAYLDTKVWVISIVDPERVAKAGDTPAVLSIRGDSSSGHHDNSAGDVERNDYSEDSNEDVVGGMASPKEEVNAKKKMVSQLSMKNRLSATSTGVKKMSMITPKSMLPPPINTNVSATGKKLPPKRDDPSESVAAQIIALKGSEERQPIATGSHITTRNTGKRKSVTSLVSHSGRKTDNSILELLQSVQFKDADSDNKFISKPRMSLADVSNPPSSSRLDIEGHPTPAAAPTPSTGVKKRSSIHIKHPGGLSTIEKFHLDHQKSVIPTEATPQRGARSTIDVNALAAAAHRAKMNKIQPSKESTPNTTGNSSPNGESGGIIGGVVGCWAWLGLLCARLMKSAKVSDEGQKTDEEGKLANDFIEMFLFGRPILFFRAVEVCIMFNCLYLAFWITNFIKICAELDAAFGYRVVGQVLMAVPLLLVIPSIGSIAQTSSLLTAVSELNLEVVHDVLIETEDVNILLEELRNKMLERIAAVETAEKNKMDIIHGLFNEIDQDGSGSIDKTEFRLLLKALKLTYSDQRFKRLYRAVDADGDNNIGIDEIDLLLNPKSKSVPPAIAKEETSSTPGGSSKNNQSEADPPFDSPIRRRGSQPARVAERLRSLSSISDYSDTDSDEEGKGGGGKKGKKQREIDSLNSSLQGNNNNQLNREADDKVVPFHLHDDSDEDMDKPTPDDLV